MPMEENTFSNQTAEHPGNEPPAYYSSSPEEPLWNVSILTPNDQTWTDCPPAYDSIPDIPIWSVPVSHLTEPTNDQQWNFPLPLPEYREAPSNPYQSSANTTISSDNFFRKKFHQGKPAVVAVLVIMCAFVQIAMSTTLVFNDDTRYYSLTISYGIPYWTSVLFITTGCMLISAKVKTTRCQVKSSIVFDVLSMILSCVGLGFNVRDIINFCKDYGPNDFCYKSDFTELNTLNISYILISANVVMLCLCLSATVIGSYVMCLPTETPLPPVTENYVIPTSPLPEFFQTPPQMSPPPYTAVGIYKEDEEDETPH